MRLIVGCGYLGTQVARLWRAAGEEIVGVVGREADVPRLRAEGIRPLVVDVTRADAVGRLEDVCGVAETILYAVGRRRGEEPSPQAVLVDGLQHVLDAIDVTGVGPVSLVLISTGGVHHRTDGDWVDETAPPNPTRPAAIAHLKAEKLLTEWLANQHTQQRRPTRGTILRLAAVYGPHRVPSVESLAAGRPIARVADRYVNLIHVQDAARVVLTVADLAESLLVENGDRHLTATNLSLYLVSDGHPVRYGDYLAVAAYTRGLSVPAVFNENAPVRDIANKRIRNDRVRTLMDANFAYPTYREGLEASIAAEAANEGGAAPKTSR